MSFPKIGQSVLIPTRSDHTRSSIPLDTIDAVYEGIKHTESGDVYQVRVKSGDVVNVAMTDKGWRDI